VVLTREDAHLVNTFSMQAAYLATESRGINAELGIHFADRGIELTRSFKALKVWMQFRAAGTDTLGATSRATCTRRTTWSRSCARIRRSSCWRRCRSTS
jgi:hypothetical protein